MTPEFHELTTQLIASVSNAYDDLVGAYDPDDIMACTDELIESLKRHLADLEHEVEYPNAAGHLSNADYE